MCVLYICTYSIGICVNVDVLIDVDSVDKQMQIDTDRFSNRLFFSSRSHLF